MTYEGSTTMPACQETVTWVVMNKPIYITKQQLHALRKLMQGDEEYQKAPLGSNFRPPQPLHNRVVRTNIDFAAVREESLSFPLLTNFAIHQDYISVSLSLSERWLQGDNA